MLYKDATSLKKDIKLFLKLNSAEHDICPANKS